MAGEIRRIHLDLAGDVGFRDFEVGDLIMAKQRTTAGTYTAEARVFAVGEEWIQVQCHNDFPAVDRLDWVRVGNETDPNRRAFIRLTGSGDGSPRQEFRARITSFEDLKSIDTLVMLEGNLDGVQHPVMGKLEGHGVLCTNLYAIGKLWVKVGDELKETGAEFKVQAERIAARVTSDEYAAALEIIDREIDARVTSDHFVSELKIRDDAIAMRVTEGEVNSAINVQASAIMLSVNDHLNEVGIKISGADKGVHVRADLFDVISTDGVKILSASSDGNWVTLNRVKMGGFVVGNMPDGGNRFEYDNDGDVIRFMPQMYTSTATGQLNVVAYFETPTDNSLNRAVYVKGVTEIYGRLDISTSLGNLSTNGNMLMMQSTSGGNISVRLKDLPHLVEEGDIQALPAGAIFADAGQEYAGSYVLRIKG